MCIGIHVKYPIFLCDFHGTWIFSRDFKKKFSNIKFHENPSSRNRVVPPGRTDMTQLVLVLRNFANWPRKRSVYFLKLTSIYVLDYVQGDRNFWIFALPDSNKNN
jgi:hypothetical protein